MKKFLICIAAAAMAIAAPAQGLGSLGIFNHLGVDAGIGTTGIHADLSTTITPWVQLRAGVSFVPSIKFNTDVDASVELNQNGYTTTQDIDVELSGNLKRTQGSVIFNIYPAGPAMGFFVAAGAYFGGQTLIGVSGHSEKVEVWQQQGLIKDSYVEIGDYKVNFQQGGRVDAALRTKNFRPYFGIGFGRPCPKGRVGFMTEFGVQLTGKLKMTQGPDFEPLDIQALDNDDTFQKVIDKLTVYPVLKFTLCGRIF